VNTYTYTQQNTVGITQPYTQLYTFTNFRTARTLVNVLETDEEPGYSWGIREEQSS
jgi:hypothetical protein